MSSRIIVKEPEIRKKMYIREWLQYETRMTERYVILFTKKKRLLKKIKENRQQFRLKDREKNVKQYWLKFFLKKCFGRKWKELNGPPVAEMVFKMKVKR